MKLTILAVGSRGDVQPCVALGCGLSDAGYDVRLVTLENFEAMVRQKGLDFLAIRGNAEALTNEMIRSQIQGNSLNLLSMYRSMMKTFGAIIESYTEAFSDPILHDSEAILCQLPAGFFGYDLAEYLKVPYIALSVIPQEMTGTWAFPLLPNRFSLGVWYNRLSYTFGQQLAWQSFRKPINQFRKRLGLTPTSFLWGNIRRMAKESVPVIQGFSEAVIPTQPEWDERIHTTGYWILDEPEWKPSTALETFLKNGTPPVFIGFGSMPVPEPQKTTTLLLDALAKSGQRGILQSGWANLGQDDLPDQVFLLDYAPYTWLFPRMSVIVHHGGSGTAGLAIRSGRPSMVVPFTADQPFWGSRIRELGVGVEPIPFSKLTSDTLAAAIQSMVENQAMQQKVQHMRDSMLGEDGVQQAVNIISDYIS